MTIKICQLLSFFLVLCFNLTVHAQSDTTKAWKIYRSPNYSYKLSAPGEAVINEQIFFCNADDCTTIEFLDQESNTYQVRENRFREYYSTNEDYFYSCREEVEIENYYRQEWIISETQHLYRGVRAKELILQVGTTDTLIRLYYIPVDNAMIELIVKRHRKDIYSKEINQFFNSLTFTQENFRTTLFERKTKKMLKDLKSIKPESRSSIRGVCYRYPFTKEELPLIYEALLQPCPDDLESFEDSLRKKNIGCESSRGILLKRLPEFDDSNAVAFIEKLYPSLYPYPRVRVAALQALFLLPYASSQRLFVKLMNDSIPIKLHSLPHDFMPMDWKLFKVNKIVYKGIFNLYRQPFYREMIYKTGIRLLDSQAIDPEFFYPAVDMLIKYNNQALAKGNTWNSFPTLYYGIPLLAYLTKDPKVVTHLTALTHFDWKTKRNQMHAFDALTALVKNKLPVDSIVVNYFAANQNYRFELYEALEKYDQLNLFPVQWLNQDSLAIAQLYWYYGAMHGFIPEKIEFVSSRIVNHNEIPSRFYLYKVLINYDPEAVVIGPYSEDKFDVGTHHAFPSREHDPYDSKTIDQHFDFLLKDF